MKGKKRIIFWIIACLLLAGLAVGGKYALDFKYYKDAMSDLTIGNIDLSQVKDGTYYGSYDAKIISAEVSVTVENGRITDVDLLEHKYERGGPAEKVIDEILKEQKPDVDAVSGATNSSKTIMKAVENALESPEAKK